MSHLRIQISTYARLSISLAGKKCGQRTALELRAALTQPNWKVIKIFRHSPFRFAPSCLCGGRYAGGDDGAGDETQRRSDMRFDGIGQAP